MNIGIIVNSNKDKNLSKTFELKKHIMDYSGNVVFTYDISKPEDREATERMQNKADVIFCLGGDGTFLKASRLIYSHDIPMVGVNLGALGFLAEIEKNNISESVIKVMNGEFVVEDRMMLEISVIRNDKTIFEDIALNDVVISRIPLSRILNISAYLNDTLLEEIPGDGLIVSSPTGCTAYSLSAGGPILDPTVEMMVLTPICPHILSSRSFVTTGDKTILAKIEKKYKHNAMVTIDGQTGCEVKGGDVIKVRKFSKCVKIIRLNPSDFYRVLRKKLYQRGEQV